ncbi:hypothetical protein [Nocardioides jishulii]|uniref:Uncharacterized protein n=1 Tax=Nocardioides jishulii TaxID=2575440 RepID=A0A4U2YS98_9ACTN|nr:hypothetical protein [Nocardioides jishulii]QCX28796.1 hypothetical protein FCL41_15610 [Nocardioides jishulii]TKI64308.1 hypothetical protein FC770_03960 [Nocardioides jishulii]
MTAAFLITPLAGCAAEPESGLAAESLTPAPLSTPTASPTASPSATVTETDCMLPVVFEGRPYRMLLIGDTPVERGGRVGEGTFGPCPGSESDAPPVTSSG